MKKSIAVVIILLLAATSASAATAYWTGRQEMVQTVTYQMAWNCEYNYVGQIFWRVFKTSCPSSIEVE
ncbi:MAG: hypothetical protein WC855_13330 [Thermodesulfovibrionales bacterium]